MRNAINKFLPYIIAATLAIFLFAAALFFETAFNRYTLNVRNLKSIESQICLLEQNKRELEKNRRILVRVKEFVDQAKVFGLEEGKWDYYDVNIEEQVYFHEARSILTQTANSRSCYFNPISLDIKKVEEPSPTSSQTVKASPGSESEQEKGDILLRLKGTFVVRQR